MNQPKEQQIQLRFPDEVLQGKYCNQLIVNHTQNEFVMDYITNFGPGAIVSSRIISNPIAFKQMVIALTDNLSKYENQFGEINLGRPTAAQPINNKIN